MDDKTIRVTDAGVIDVFVFTTAGMLAVTTLELARERVGEAWWDDYDERRRVVDVLIAGRYG